jgi:hypothetical protein
MLEERPILQRSLIGFGAFSFIFTAAMAGTAFMISGGFDMGGAEQRRPRSIQDYAVATETAWTDWSQPAYAATPASALPVQAPAAPSAPDDAFEPTSYSSAQLEGDPPQLATPAQSEADILRDIERELATYENSGDTYADEAVGPPRLQQSDSDIIAAKERAATAEGDGPY